MRQQAESLWRNNWRERNKTDPGEPGQFALESAARGVSRLRTQFAGVLWLLMGGVGLLALMVCANIAGLVMARTAGRQGELAVRVAMGATRPALVRQLFTEGMLLMAGGAAGAIALLAAGDSFCGGRAAAGARSYRRASDAGARDRSGLASARFRAGRYRWLRCCCSAWLRSGGGAARSASAAEGGARGRGWRGRQLLVVIQVAPVDAAAGGRGADGTYAAAAGELNAGFDSRSHR